MTSGEAQKSEVHDATADADGSPTADDDASATRAATHATSATEHSYRTPSPLTPGTHILKDETSVGGPLVIESDDPDLLPPRVPIDPFPTDRTPEVDPPVTQ